MKLTLKTINGEYSVEEGSPDGTIEEVLELVERLLIVAGYSIKVGSLDVKEEEK